MGNGKQGPRESERASLLQVSLRCSLLLFSLTLSILFAFYFTSPPTNQPTPSFTLALASGREHELDELEEFAKERKKKEEKEETGEQRGGGASKKQEENVPTDMVDRICSVSALDLYIYNDILYFSIMQQAIIILIQQLRTKFHGSKFCFLY